MREFIEMRISPEGFQQDVLAGVLYFLGCLGIHEVSGDDWRIYFSRDWASENAEALFKRLKALNPAFDETSVALVDVPFQDWGREWKQYFKPLQPVEGVWIRPPWEKLPVEARGIDVLIDPQMAFGTGHHETTILMMKLMNEMSFNGLRVLDLGTGSGILAVLAARLGAERIVAVDNDPNAINNTRHNVKLNRIRNIEVKSGDIQTLEREEFDVALANINSEALEALAAKWKDLLTDGGKVIISGILTSETEPIESLYNKAGLTLLKRKDMNEWSAMLWERT